MRELIEKVKIWGAEKGITTSDEPTMYMRRKQAFKTQEELEELWVAIAESDEVEAKDAIGDIIVTLIMQAEWWDTDIEECLELAYNVISKRKGKMIDGQFVKAV